MPRSSLALSACLILGSCQTSPVAKSLPPPAAPSTVRLFQEEVEPSRDAVARLIHDRIPVGTTVADGRALLEHEGLSCRPYSPWLANFSRQKLIPMRPEFFLSEESARLNTPAARRGTYCQANLRELQGWRLNSYQLLVVLVPADDETIASVEVFLEAPRSHPCRPFLENHPDLEPPVGLPLEQAKSQMVAAGFHCGPFEPAGPEKGSGGFLPCQAYDEGILGGTVVRVRLHADGSGQVRDVEVLGNGSLFDCERCMLPHGDESPLWAVGKAALFPVRVGCLYTLVAGGICLVCCLPPGGGAR